MIGKFEMPLALFFYRLTHSRSACMPAIANFPLAATWGFVDQPLPPDDDIPDEADVPLLGHQNEKNTTQSRGTVISPGDEF